ncbi:hypothetical protein AtubIFM61612_008471 [Aspergillus tubingensis]|nr:hypothetical protein AtubIFM61612_008471 [Aspergillus tubingensis]
MEGELDELRVMMKEPLTEEDRESAEMLRQNTAEINAKFAAAERTQQDLKVTMEQMHCKGLSAFRSNIEAQRRENRMIREKLGTLEALQHQNPSLVPEIPSSVLLRLMCRKWKTRMIKEVWICVGLGIRLYLSSSNRIDESC